MSKGLNALERLKSTLLAENYWQDILQDVFIIEKELNVLKVIIKKAHIQVGKMDGQYYFKTTHTYYFISKEKYDLLKEVLL